MMRKPSLVASMVVACAIVAAGALTAFPVTAQPQGKPPAPAPVTAYKPVAVKPPSPMTDASFTTFRRQLTNIAQQEDHAALARLVSNDFFWAPLGKDMADKNRPGMENLTRAIGLGGREAPGWFTIAAIAQESSAAQHPQRQGVFCAPAPPTYDPKAFLELIKTTKTAPLEWVYPVRAGIEVRATAKPGSEAVEKLGMHLVRVLYEEQPASETLMRVATPSGKTGYVGSDFVRDLSSMLLCYVKDGTSWKIAGYTGGYAEAAK